MDMNFEALVKIQARTFLYEFQKLSAYEQRLLHAHPAMCPLQDAVQAQRSRMERKRPRQDNIDIGTTMGADQGYLLVPLTC
jgi:hypothetical protein